MAPEMLTSAWAADVRSDLYSLGVTLFELLTGRLPFTAQNLGGLVREHREARPPDPRRFCPWLPREVAALVSSLLLKDPLRRPPTARALMDRLVRLEIEHLPAR
jgi:serine/threonine protein kinase